MDNIYRITIVINDKTKKDDLFKITRQKKYD